MALAATLLRGALGSVRRRPPYEGASLPGTPLARDAVRPDPERVTAYAELCGFPRDGDRLPATYPHLLGFPLAMRLMAARDFPFPMLGLVHTAIDVVQHRALTTADRPTVRVHAEGLAPHRRGSEFRVVTSVSLDGAEVWSSRSTYLCRHRRTEQEGSGGGRSGDEPPPGLPGPAGDDADPADLLPRARWELPGDLGRRYGAVSGDRNPIHLHPLTARVFGFPRALAHGMWTFARCLAETAGGAETVRAEARFLAPVLLPGTVVLHAQDGAFALRDGSGGSRLHVSGRVSSGTP